MTANEAYLLPTEDGGEFEQLLRSLEQTHLPANAHERILVEQFASAYWELRRARRIDREFWQYVGGHYHPGEVGIAEALAQEKESKFRIHLRLRAQVERSYYRALDALERMHRNRDRTAREITAPADLPTDPPAAAAGTSGPVLVFPDNSAAADRALVREDATNEPPVSHEHSRAVRERGISAAPITASKSKTSFYGMWSDRDDIADGISYVNALHNNRPG